MLRCPDSSGPIRRESPTIYSLKESDRIGILFAMTITEEDLLSRFSKQMYRNENLEG